MHLNQTTLPSRSRRKSLSYILAHLRSHIGVERILKTIDLEQFKVYQKRYKDDDPPPTGYSKYLDIRTWMAAKLIYVYLLNLHKARPMRILDMGTGPGYFPYVCSFYGHKVVAIDLDTIPMYNELCQFLHVDRRVWRINRFENLPDFGVKFDLVTAFMIKFDQHDSPDQWGADEWSFMLEDLKRNHLTENGRILLNFNSRHDGTWEDDSLLRLFYNMGGRVHHNFIDIGGPPA